jgi:hypothetical protein
VRLSLAALLLLLASTGCPTPTPAAKSEPNRDDAAPKAAPAPSPEPAATPAATPEVAPAEKAAEAPPAAPAPPVESAIVSSEAGLQLVALATGAKTTVFPGVVDVCLAHPEASAIWFTGHDDDEAATSTLYAVDLARGTTPLPLATAIPREVAALAVVTWKAGTKESDYGGDFEVGLRLDLRSVPSAGRFIGCMTDVLDCYADIDTQALHPNLEALATKVDGVKLSDPGTAKRLGDRAAQPPKAAKTPAPPKVTVDRSKCEEEPDDCGTTAAIPGTDLQLVVTGNSRGDYFHEDLQLYDAKTGMFMLLSDPTKTSKTPHPEAEELSRLYVAGSGEAYATDSRVIHLKRGTLVEDVGVCGFTTAGAVLTGVAL